jgi:hypothetical protein
LLRKGNCVRTPRSALADRWAAMSDRHPIAGNGRHPCLPDRYGNVGIRLKHVVCQHGQVAAVGRVA